MTLLPHTEIGINDPKKSKNSFIVRDLILWFTFIFIIPIVVFIVFFLSKESLESDSKVQKRISINEPMSQVILGKYPNSVCNDGSAASYYIRTSDTNKVWLILLDGGYFCYDKQSCSQRYQNSFNLTSSYGTRQIKFGSGILSSDSNVNKYWYNANIVNIPYCSSDLWTGRKRCKNCTDEFSFMGAQIIDDVFEDLFQNTELSKSSVVLLTGESAGGVGVLMNVNRIRQKFDLYAPQTQLKVIIDSSWQLDLPFSYLCNSNNNNNKDNNNECPMNRIFQNSIKYWNSHIPDECAREETKSLWNCFLPNIIIPFIQVPVFMIQSKFDESQLLEQFNQVEVDAKEKVLPLVETFKLMEIKLKKSLEKLKSYFITSCMNHMVLTRDDWNYSKVDDLSLPDAIFKWAMMNENERDLENLKILDKCSFPDCLGTCPPMRHPQTNRIINPFDYAKYLGLVSYESISKLLNLNEFYVKKMNYFKLMKLLMN